MNALRLARARSGPFDSAARSAVMSEALIKAESNGDPNGIRTRVTAVTGRSTRPLDDRVTKSAQYRNCYSLTQGKLPNCFQALGLARLRAGTCFWSPRLQPRI